MGNDRPEGSEVFMRRAMFVGLAASSEPGMIFIPGGEYSRGRAHENTDSNLPYYPNPLRDLYLSLSRRDRGRLRARFASGIRRYRSGPVLRVPGFAWVVAGRR